MKEEQLRKHTECDICGEKVLHYGTPLFWTATFKRYGVLMDAIQRQDGLAALIGSTRIAQAMGNDSELTEEIMSVTLTICEPCMWGDDVNLSRLVENKQEEIEAATGQDSE